MRVTSKVSLVVNIFVVLLGAGIFIFGFYLVKEGYRVKDTFIKTTGIVYNIKIEHDYSSEVANTQEYLQIEFSLPSGEKIKFTNDYSRENIKFKIGDQIPVYYNPTKSENAYVADDRFLFLPGGICLFMGTVFMIFAGQYVVKNNSRKKNIARIKLTGMKIQAPLIEASEDLQTTIMNRHPFIIKVEMNDGKILNSDEIWNYDPEKLKPGQLVDAYFDPQKPDDYYVDVEFLNNK